MTTKHIMLKALREQVWLKTNKHVFKVKCPIIWCQNEIADVFFWLAITWIHSVNALGKANATPGMQMCKLLRVLVKHQLPFCNHCVDCMRAVVVSFGCLTAVAVQLVSSKIDEGSGISGGAGAPLPEAWTTAYVHHCLHTFSSNHFRTLVAVWVVCVEVFRPFTRVPARLISPTGAGRL